MYTARLSKTIIILNQMLTVLTIFIHIACQISIEILQRLPPTTD